MVFSFWNAAGRLELAASTCAKRVKFRGEAGFLRMAMPFAGCREASSSLVARGRVIEREWGNPQRFPPHTPPSLRYARVRTTKPEGNHKKKHHPSGWCFLFGMSRAGLNSLPRPARSALNQEVRQGSCEWLCHSWDAGSESSLVARSKKERHPHGCLSFLEQHFCYAKVVACGRVIEREWGIAPAFSAVVRWRWLFQR